MSYMQDSIDWQTIDIVNDWLDRKVASKYHDQPLAQDWARISKVIEELGEAIQAFIGYTGQNPRKGVTHSKEEVLDELGDTALTAILAMYHFTSNSVDIRQILSRKQKLLLDRIPKQEWYG